MSTSSCIRHIENEPLVIVRQSYVTVCNGNHCAASLLNHFEFCYNAKLVNLSQNKSFKRLKNETVDNQTQYNSLLQWHTQEELESALLHLYGVTKIKESIKELEDLGLITKHKNPNTKFGFDRTNFFMFNPKILNQKLDEIRLSCTEVENDQSISQKEILPLVENDQAITENTTKTSTREVGATQKNKNEEKDVKKVLENKFPNLINFPGLYKIVEAIENKAPENYREYINFVAENKKNEKIFIVKYWQEYFFEDFWAKNKSATYENTESTVKHNLDMYQRDNESISEFESRCINRESLGDVRIIKHYTKTNTVTGNDLKSKFELAKQAMLQAKTPIY